MISISINYYIQKFIETFLQIKINLFAYLKHSNKFNKNRKINI